MPHRTRIAATALCVVIAVALAGSLPAGAATLRSRDSLFRATNDSRLDHEVRRVDLSDRLSQIARRHSAKMARTRDLFHTKDPAKTYLQGVRWHTWGENVGVTSGSVADVQRAFMDSPDHRANILNTAFRHVAVGAVRRDGILWVTVFFWG